MAQSQQKVRADEEKLKYEQEFNSASGITEFADRAQLFAAMGFKADNPELAERAFRYAQVSATLALHGEVRELNAGIDCLERATREKSW